MAYKNCWKCDHFDEDYNRCELGADHFCMERIIPEHLQRVEPDDMEEAAGLTT